MMPNFLRKDRDEKREKSLSIYAFCLNVIAVAGRGKGARSIITYTILQEVFASVKLDYVNRTQFIHFSKRFSYDEEAFNFNKHE